MQVSFSVDELTRIVQPGATRGSTAETIRSIASLDEAAPGDLSFLGNAKYKAQVATSRASLLLLPADYEGEPAPGQLYFLVENPSMALARICAKIEQSLWPKPAPGIHPSASVDPQARIASTATVGPLCVVEAGAVVGDRAFLEAQVFVGRDARVGEDSWLMPGVVLGSYCQLGKRVRLQPGVIIGSDGFGYEFIDGRHAKVPQVGTVVIEDDVEIGANSTLDRARFSRTVVGEGTKIDNLVQVGHNVTIGKHCILCAFVGISGSSTIEDYVVLAGQAGVGGHITIGRGSKVGGQAGVTGSLPAGSYVIGNPCLPFHLDRRLNVLKQRLPDLFKRVGQIEESLKMLSGK
ncbi:MAG: UDP-3-O-(3-hydroxymyristoyl)glucosamine N-acyltransferase [Opitutaceae bacterium]|jgi:UDP-3-O-[3-hydroxymyristoyl] glucosamine N-acyltransferase